MATHTAYTTGVYHPVGGAVLSYGFMIHIFPFALIAFHVTYGFEPCFHDLMKCMLVLRYVQFMQPGVAQGYTACSL